MTTSEQISKAIKIGVASVATSNLVLWDQQA